MTEAPLLAVLHGRLPVRIPVWIMRQAGRALPEYRTLRAHFPDFTTFLATPQAAAEATVQPVDALGVDAAILFSDILVLLPPLGLTLAYHDGTGPVLGNCLSTPERIRSLPRFDPAEDLRPVLDAIREAKSSLAGRVPLLGFAAAPWTLACYAVDGGGHGFPKTRGLLHRDPELFGTLLERLSDVTVDYLCAQAEAGVQAVQLFESWGLLLDAATYTRQILPHTARVIHEVRNRTGIPVILYGNGSSLLHPAFATTEADALGLDWRIPLREVHERFPARPLQGNLDPASLLGTPETIGREVSAMAEGLSGHPWIANLGHGILPGTPLENTLAFIDSIHRLSV